MTVSAQSSTPLSFLRYAVDSYRAVLLNPVVTQYRVWTRSLVPFALHGILFMISHVVGEKAMRILRDSTCLWNSELRWPSASENGSQVFTTIGLFWYPRGMCTKNIFRI